MKIKGNVPQVVFHRMVKEKKCLMLKQNELNRNEYYNIPGRRVKDFSLQEIFFAHQFLFYDPVVVFHPQLAQKDDVVFSLLVMPLSQ